MYKTKVSSGLIGSHAKQIKRSCLNSFDGGASKQSFSPRPIKGKQKVHCEVLGHGFSNLNDTKLVDILTSSHDDNNLRGKYDL